jgi:DNA polymerase-4
MGSQRALGRGPKDRDEVRATLHGIVDRVTRRMRAADRPGRTVVLRFRFDDFSRVTRSRTLSEATIATEPILRVSLELLDEMWPTIERRGLTLIGLSVSGLDDSGALQLTLPFDDRSALDAALDGVKEKFGGAAISRVAIADGDDARSVPMLPD